MEIFFLKKNMMINFWELVHYLWYLFGNYSLFFWQSNYSFQSSPIQPAKH